MSIDKYPAKGKLATSLDTQIAWLVREMGYSRDKLSGYEEKLVRLARDPSDSTSVFGFMSGYWHRFRQANGNINLIPEQAMAYRALQAGAKVVAGLSDKVAFSLWLDDQAQGVESDPEVLLDTALGMVRARVEVLDRGDNSDEELLAYNDRPFEENPMGAAILALHQNYSQDPYNTQILRHIAIDGSAAGILMWQAYARSIEQQGYASAMPKPGLSSGNIETWD